MVPPQPRTVQKTGGKTWNVLERGEVIGSVRRIGTDQFEASLVRHGSVVTVTKGYAVAAIFRARARMAQETAVAAFLAPAPPIPPVPPISNLAPAS